MLPGRAPTGVLHIKPKQDALSSCTYRRQHMPVEAGSVGNEAVDVVDGRGGGSLDRLRAEASALAGHILS